MAAISTWCRVGISSCAFCFAPWKLRSDFGVSQSVGRSGKLKAPMKIYSAPYRASEIWASVEDFVSWLDEVIVHCKNLMFFPGSLPTAPRLWFLQALRSGLSVALCTTYGPVDPAVWRLTCLYFKYLHRLHTLPDSMKSKTKFPGGWKRALLTELPASYVWAALPVRARGQRSRRC